MVKTPKLTKKLLPELANFGQEFFQLFGITDLAWLCHQIRFPYMSVFTVFAVLQKDICLILQFPVFMPIAHHGCLTKLLVSKNEPILMESRVIKLALECQRFWEPKLSPKNPLTMECLRRCSLSCKFGVLKPALVKINLLKPPTLLIS